MSSSRRLSRSRSRGHKNGETRARSRNTALQLVRDISTNLVTWSMFRILRTNRSVSSQAISRSTSDLNRGNQAERE